MQNEVLPIILEDIKKKKPFLKGVLSKDDKNE